MSVLQAFVQGPLAGALGWTLLASLWQGALASAALGAVLLVTRSPRVRYASALLAMLLIVGGFGITLVRLLPETLHPPHDTGFTSIAGTLRTAPDVPGPWSDSGFLAALAPWLAPFWMAGVAIFYLRHAAGFMALRRLRRRGVCAAPDRWQRELARLSSRVRVTRPIALLESCLAEAPLVLGHLRPAILLPAGLLAGLPAGQIEAILLHELAHIRRHDYLLNVLQRLAEGLLFYHPAVWWIARVIRTERENCCDDRVVSIRGDAVEYAAALASLEQNRSRAGEPAVAATGGSLVTRIQRLLYPKASTSSWTPFLGALILIATGAITLAAWPDAHAQTPSAARIQQDRAVWSKWLNEDVVYIIDDAERAAFLRLAGDAERDKFIEQFWERRNPTPGASRNAFKEEHYRRIAYANSHFATAGAPGWQTDRGHMYIVWGPPDELEAHPASSQSPHGTEVWAYRHVESTGDKGTFTFIDRSGHGDYRLAPGNAHF